MACASLFSSKTSKKPKKVLKKVLTNGRRSGIICRLSWERQLKITNGSRSERFKRSLEENGQAEQRSESFRLLKKFQKTFRKPLDKRNQMWYNRKVGARNRGWQTVIENWTIRDEVQSKDDELKDSSFKVCAKESRTILKRIIILTNYYSNKVKEQIMLEKISGRTSVLF